MRIPMLDVEPDPEWWEILASHSAELPFRAFFDELQPSPIYQAEDIEMPSAVDLELLLRARVAEPIEGWRAFLARTNWGDDASMIQDWFEAGDSGRATDGLIFEEAEPAGFDRALGWVRSLAVATKLIPA